jgi:hypothetical protein
VDNYTESVDSGDGGDVIIMGLDITKLVNGLSDCTKACITAEPGVSLPLTKSEIVSICPSINSLIASVTSCIASKSCPATEGAYMSTIPGICKQILANAGGSGLFPTV